MIRILSLLFCSSILFAQVPYTANDTVPPYNNAPYFGTNMGFYEGWTDENLATMAAGMPSADIDGIGAKTFRPAMFDYFIEQHGLDVRVNAFDHYKKLGMYDLVCFIGYPSEKNRETEEFCENERSALFKNMYEPIWEEGFEGEKVNPNNPCAVFIKKTIDTYSESVKIWEIWNEPDFTFAGNGDRKPGDGGNWWDEDPPYCEIAIKAPIQHYVRMLRISYAVIKTFRPEDLVAVGGLGYESFLDAILRNTDNPNGGAVTEEFPLKGGAYFDVLSYHVYPHINGSLRSWNNFKFGFDYYRHSDAAAQAVIDKQYSFENLMESYGYNGTEFPKKHTILTETNIPRFEIDDFIGSELAQRNFVMKSLVLGKVSDIKQYHIYNLSEGSFAEGHTSDFNAMGLYKSFSEEEPLSGQLTESGVGFKTLAKLLENMTYDPSLTENWTLPSDVKAYGFIDKNNTVRYAIWAKTSEDKVENVSMELSLPSESGIVAYNRYNWDFGKSNVSQTISGSDVNLGASPIIIEPVNAFTLAKDTYLKLFPNPYTEDFTAQFDIPIQTNVTLEVFDLQGKLLGTIEDQQNMAPGRYRKAIFNDAVPSGVYYVRLTTSTGKITKKILKQ